MLKVLALILLGLMMTLVTAIVVTLFFYAGWNLGVVPALSFAKKITLMQAFWLSLTISTVCNCFKSSLSIKE
jgi:hypothetical protein